ncbi:MAG TPA: hypothetical protein VG413_05240 [Candidatus Dormibacteraeota bacterium]|nr:hypothetical protein [Candidatus Dormibacteraeota bacterium]
MLAFRPLSHARPWARAGLIGVVVIAVLSGCDLPVGLDLPTTRSLETGATGSLSAADSFEITGSYSEGSSQWSIDLQLSRPDSEHVTVTTPDLKLEAIILGNNTYFRGQQFLSAHMGSDLVSRSFVKAAGDGWWKGSAGQIPHLTDLTDGNAFRSTFLGQAVTKRSDHVSVDGTDAVDLSGARGEVFITAQAPYRVLRVRLKHGVVVDGIRDADLRFINYNHDFQISPPTSVIDFSNLTTLPPIYTVVSVDTSGCGSPCAVSALLKNLGGLVGARGPSTITFAMTDTASRQVLGSCQARVVPDVPYNATTTVTCSIENVSAQSSNAASVTATPDNPGRG